MFIVYSGEDMHFQLEGTAHPEETSWLNISSPARILDDDYRRKAPPLRIEIAVCVAISNPPDSPQTQNTLAPLIQDTGLMRQFRP
jgi:hypothetical protein